MEFTELKAPIAVGEEMPKDLRPQNRVSIDLPKNSILPNQDKLV